MRGKCVANISLINVTQGKAGPTTAATTTAGNGKGTTTAGSAGATKTSLAIKNTGHQLLCFGSTAFVLLVGLL